MRYLQSRNRDLHRPAMSRQVQLSVCISVKPNTTTLTILPEAVRTVAANTVARKARECMVTESRVGVSSVEWER